MSKVNLPAIPGGYLSLGAMNTRLAAIEDAFENTLSLDGTVPNSMEADLDMDSNDILNVGLISVDDINVQGLTTGGILTEASEAAAAASISAQEAEQSALDASANAEAVQVDSVSELRTSTFPANIQRLWLMGYYGVGTAGGGPLYRDSGDTTTADNGGTVFVDAEGVRWKRPKAEARTLYEFGAVSDGVTDNSAAIQSALGASTTILIPEGVFLLKEEITVSDNKTLAGYNKETSVLAWSAPSSGELNTAITVGSNVIFRDMQIRGYREPLDNLGYTSNGIQSTGTSECEFVRCKVVKWNRLIFIGGENHKITDCYFDEAPYVDDQVTFTAAYGVLASVTTNLLVRGCFFGDQIHRHSLYFTSPNNNFATVVGNTIFGLGNETYAYSGNEDTIKLEGGSGHIFSENRIISDVSSVAIFRFSQDGAAVTISGNILESPQGGKTVRLDSYTVVGAQGNLIITKNRIYGGEISIVEPCNLHMTDNFLDSVAVALRHISDTDITSEIIVSNNVVLNVTGNIWNVSTVYSNFICRGNIVRTSAGWDSDFIRFFTEGALIRDNLGEHGDVTQRGVATISDSDSVFVTHNMRINQDEFLISVTPLDSLGGASFHVDYNNNQSFRIRTSAVVTADFSFEILRKA